MRDRDNNYVEATRLMEKNRYTQALYFLEEIEAVDPGYQDIQKLKLKAKERIPAEMSEKFPEYYRQAEEFKAEFLGRERNEK